MEEGVTTVTAEVVAGVPTSFIHVTEALLFEDIATRSTRATTMPVRGDRMRKTRTAPRRKAKQPNLGGK